MPSWDEIINQVESAPNGVIDITRKEYISKLAEIRGRNVICYYSGWLQDSQGVQETSLLDTDMTGFMTNVHELDRSRGLDLILHTPGGDLAAAEKLVDYLRDCFDGDIEAIVGEINDTPMKLLGYKTPNEVWDEEIAKLQSKAASPNTSVALTN